MKMRGQSIVLLLAACSCACSAFVVNHNVASRRSSMVSAKKELKKEVKRNTRPTGKGRKAQGSRRGDLVRGIMLDTVPSVGGKEEEKASDDPLVPMVECVVKAADDRKASASRVFYVAPVTDVCSFVVLTNGRSRPQNDAIAASIVDDVEERFGRKPRHVEGGADGGWTLIDFGDVIVNVMTPLSREFYDLDNLWAPKAPEFDVSHLVTPDSDILVSADDDADAEDDYLPLAEDDEWSSWLDEDDDPSDILNQAAAFLEENQDDEDDDQQADNKSL